MHDPSLLDTDDENARPSRKGPLAAIAFLPVFWWLMYGMAADPGGRSIGRRAAIKAVMRFFAEMLGTTGCLVLGFGTFLGALYWLWHTMQAQSEWDRNARLEALRERQRFAQARAEATSRPDA
jgi:hypothetical protein